MEQVFIWSETQLNTLLASPLPQAQSWAVARLFMLYPDSAEARSPALLQSKSESLVLAVLRHMGPKPRPESFPTLKALYDSEHPEIRTQVLQLCGTWRVQEALDWVRDRILAAARFSSEEIAAMIRLLGLLRDGRAYELLKGTENAIREERSWKWQVFYAALLRHGKPEDLVTLIDCSLNPEEPDSIRSAALEILFDVVDPTLNPTDVLYGNHPAVREHLLGRLQYLDEVTRDKPSPASGHPVFHELARLIGGLKTGEQALPPSAFESLAAAHTPMPGLAAELFSQSLGILQQGSRSDEQVFPLQVLTLSAFIRSLFDHCLPLPGPNAPWEERVDYVLRYPTHWEPLDLPWQDAIGTAPREALIDKLIACIQLDQAPWITLHAIEMLGSLKAPRGQAPILALLQRGMGPTLRDAALDALKRMGPPIVDELLPLLDSSDGPIRDVALELLAPLPLPRVVDALSARMPVLLEHNRPQTLAACESIAAPAFYGLLEREHRSGEWDLARVCVHIAQINGLSPPSLETMERDVREAERYEEARRSPSQMPDALRLELLCHACGKPYRYLVREIHVHPRGPEQTEPDSESWIPYHQGIVITDDIRCKNCGRLNDYSLTRNALAQLTSHGVELQAKARLGMEPPRHNPVQIVSFPSKDGKDRSLLEIEREHLEAVERHPGRPESHLAAGKFYEYVKQYSKAKQAYLLALDMDSGTLEAMAGLARLFHADGRLEDAYEWIDRCYRQLTKGRIFLAEDPTTFKSMVREKRREYARAAGIRPNEETVEIRYRIETSDYPKNRLCPCGSGRKYKACCMPRDSR